MPLVTLVCFGLLGMADGSIPTADVAASYQQVKSAAGRAPADQVRLALWCEAHGLSAERMRHLALALLADPTNTTARGLAGLVARDGRWVAPDRVAATVRTDTTAQALLAEYDRQRSRTPYTADAQWELGQWADERGLPDQARAHFTAVTRLDPSRELAWKRLGYKKHDGRWTTDAQLANDRAEAEAQKLADRTWKAQLEKWKTLLAQPSRQDEARAGLLGVTDPRAVPAIVRVFGTDRAGDQRVAAGLLGQIASPQASRALAALAVFSPSAEVRRVAVETLRQRDPRDFVGFWISLIRQPIEYEVQPVGGPGSPGALLIKGQKANSQRIYRPMDMPNPAYLTAGKLQSDANGLPVVIFDQRTAIPSGPRINQRQLDAMRRDEAANAQRFTQQLTGLPLPNAGRSLFTEAIDSQMLTSQTTVKRLTKATVGNGITIPGEYSPVFNSEIQVPIGQMMVDSQRSAAVAQAQLAMDVASLERQNRRIRQNNELALLALGDLTGEHHGDEPELWQRWWVDQQGYALSDASTATPPTIVENVPIGFTPTASPIVIGRMIGFAEARHSCFGAGTPVRTIDGTRRVETIQRGDLILTQNTKSGAPVLSTCPERLPQPAQLHVPDQAGGGSHRGHRYPPVLEGGAGVGDGS